LEKTVSASIIRLRSGIYIVLADDFGTSRLSRRR
jgi:hypothetical protein